MRKIDKCPNVPKSLVDAPVPKKVEEVKTSIYKADDVRDQLITDQNSKCAYCETVIPKEFNDVEHYRPKTAYYWLGHEWSNFLYACNLCNRTFKNDYFPIEDEKVRYDIRLEKPLIINPCVEDPLEHIQYNKYIIVPRMVNGVVDAKGITTIEMFHLNDKVKRPTLVNARQQLYEQYERYIKLKIVACGIINSCNPPSAKQKASELVIMCNQAIQKMKCPSAPFSGMLVGLTKRDFPRDP